MPTGPERQAKVKWFNGEKGFGFVELTDGSGEAFLHISVVEGAGHTALESGTTLTVRVGQGAKGPQITEITAVDASTAEPSRGRGCVRYAAERGMLGLVDTRFFVPRRKGVCYRWLRTSRKN